MKKTISVNIKGLNFMIEEDAYEMLHHYMKRLESSLSGQKGAKDIIEDIELRIAELCQTYLSDKKQVIEKEDIETIVKTLGQPEDFLDDETQAEEQSYRQQTTEQNLGKEKQLYRDIEQAKIAGICAGLSNYFNMDVIVVRLIFLAFLFFGGFGFPLYVILWIILPKATSSIDRLRMQGKPITVDSVKDEVEQAATRLSSSSRSFADKIRKDENMSKRFSSLGRAITSVVAMALIVTGIFFLIIFLVLFFGGMRFAPIQGEDGFLSFSQLGELLLSDAGDVLLAWIGIILLAFSVILFLISNGTFLLLRIKSKWTKLSSLALIGFGFIGFVVCLYMGMKTAREVLTDGEIEKEIAQVDAPELLVEKISKKIPELQGFEEKGGDHGMNDPILVRKKIIRDYGIKFIYRPSRDSLYHVYQNLSANSNSYKTAILKAKNIRHDAFLENNILKVSSEFLYPKRDKIRAQRVVIIIEIPKNKWVRIGDERISTDYSVEEELEKEGYLRHNGNYEHWD